MAKILIIDDDPLILDMLRQTLEREGYDVYTASDGELGIEKFQRDPTDIIITDLVMPIKEGIETIVELRHQYPDVKIIAISGGGRTPPQEYLALAKGLGAEAAFTKPIPRDQLLLTIKKMLD